MACIEQNDSKEKPNLAEEGSDDRQSTSDQESVVTAVRRIYVVDVRISFPKRGQFSFYYWWSF